MTPRFLFLDLETTGLDPNRCAILEVGLILTTERLEEIQALDFTIQPPAAALEEIAAVPKAMHLQNGLLVEAPDGTLRVTGIGASLAEAEDLLCSLAPHVPPADRLVLGGSSVHFDRAFLRVWMPRFEARLLHRHFDASTAVLLDPTANWPRSTGPAHRAATDVRRSLDTLRHARAMVGA